MAKIVQMYRGPTSQVSVYTGPVGQLVVDTTRGAVRVQDGVTPGGDITLMASHNLDDVADKAAAKANLEIGTAADHDTSYFDLAGSADAALVSAKAYADAGDSATLYSAEVYTDNAAAGAIATAAADATTKANAAQAAAIAAAATDATTKSNAAQAAAIAAAATDATTKANAAVVTAEAASCQRASNLGDVASAATARTNLGFVDFTQSGIATTINTFNEYFHGLGAAPARITAYIVCTSSDLGYAIGDCVPISNGGNQGNDRAITVFFNATKVGYAFGNGAGLQIIPKGAGASASITTAKWTLTLIAHKN